MRLIDANLLIYAYDSSSPHHDRARSWLEERLSEPQPVLLPWSVLLAFIRITTDSRILGHPFSLVEAAEIVGEWLEQPNVTLTAAGQEHWPILRRLLVSGQARGALVADAHLAALALEHGATLCTNDRDFARFEPLRVEYPLLDDGWVHQTRATYDS